MRNYVAFNIGRDRRGNSGHKTYVDDIENFQTLLHRAVDNGEIYIIYEDDENNLLPIEEEKVVTPSGNVLLEGEEVEAMTGILDIDGQYNTTIVKDIDDCTDEEYKLIIKEYNSCGFVDEDVLDQVCDKLNLTHVHKVKHYHSNVEIFTNPSSRLNGFIADDVRAYTEEEFTEYLRDKLCVLEADIDDIVIAVDDWFKEDDEDDEEE